MPALYVSVTAVVSENTCARARFIAAPDELDGDASLIIDGQHGAPLTITGNVEEIDRILATWAHLLGQLRTEHTARFETAGVEP